MLTVVKRLWRGRAVLAALILFAAVVYLVRPLDRWAGPGPRGSETGRGSLSDAMAGLQFMNRQRAYPLPDIPADRYTRAFEQVVAQQRLTRRRTAAGSGEAMPPPWRPIGPHNVGGRTISIAIDPVSVNRIWVGAASGGLWKSETGGLGADAWSYVDTGFPVLGVNAIAIDPVDPQTIYIGTGEVYSKESSIGGLYIRTTRGSYGIGILRTTDGGATWSKSLDWSYEQRRGVLALDIDPNDPNRVFAGTSEGVYRSLDGGDSWSRVLDVPMAVDLVINPVNSDTLFASCGNLGTPSNAGIWRSMDGGDTWQELGGGLPASWTGKTMLDLYMADPNIVYADVANALSDQDPAGVGLYRSLDSGETWERLTLGYPSYNRIARYQGWFSHFVVVNPADSSQVIVSGVDTYKSTDGGRTFSRRSYWYLWDQGVTPIGGSEGPSSYSHADHHAFARSPTDPNTVLLATDGGIFATRDFGETFQARNGGYQTTQFYAGFSSAPNDSNLALGGLQDNSTVIYHGTPAWERTLGGDGGFTGIDPESISYMLASTQYGRIYISRERGAPGTWWRGNEEMEDGTEVVFVAPFVQSPQDPDFIYAGRTRVWRSNNAGEFWVAMHPEPLDGNPILALAVSALDKGLVWAATVPATRRAGVYYSVDGGRNWRDVTGGLPDRYPVDIVMSPHASNRTYVVFSGFGTGHVFRFINAIQGWKDITGTFPDNLPDVPTSAIAVDPFNPDYLYVGNDFGVWFSPDDGQTWQPFTDGMPTAALVMDLSISASNRSIRAVTHGLGVWERPLVGTPADVPPADRGIRLLQNRPNPFNSVTRITYYLPEGMRVRLEIYNVRGQLVRVLADELKPAGYNTTQLNGSELASGIYIYRLVAGGKVLTRRLLLLK